jgi:hypothetical protein
VHDSKKFERPRKHPEGLSMEMNVFGTPDSRSWDQEEFSMPIRKKIP